MFHVDSGGQATGPFNPGQLQSGAQSGQITRATLVWSDGMPGWLPAGQVPALAALFGVGPPPLPPTAPASAVSASAPASAWSTAESS